MPRLFTATTLPRNDFPQTITLREDAAQHVRVLRLALGDDVTLFDGCGGEFAARLTVIDKRRVEVELAAWHEVERESPLDITLVQSLATSDKMDWIVQKATELGVTAIVPMKSQRATLKLDGDRAEKRVAHWQAIAIAACEQCGRNRIPAVSTIQAMPETLASTGRLAILHPAGAQRLTVWAQATPHAPMALMIGPEGGFSDEEIALATAKDATLVTLGSRVLRTETAGIAALAAIQATLGDFG